MALARSGMNTTLTTKRAALVELALRAARARAFDPNPAIADRAARRIAQCKTRLSPQWAARAEEERHRVGQRKLDTWA